MTITADTLNNGVDFDTPFRVHDDGTVSTDEPYVYTPDCRLADPEDGDTSDDVVTTRGWRALTGWTGQYGYSGAVMHPSESIGGGLAEHLLTTPGVYVVVEVRDVDDSLPDGDPIGWAILTTTR